MKGKAGLEGRFWGASLMIKEAHVSLDVSFFDQNYEAICREIDAYFTPYTSF